MAIGAVSWLVVVLREFTMVKCISLNVICVELDPDQEIAPGGRATLAPSFCSRRDFMPATATHSIPGTTLFDGAQAQKGYALNKMCFSFNSAENRATFRADEIGYMLHYGLSAEQIKAIRARDVLGLLDAGGNVYYLAKFAGILGLDVQDLGAAQTGLSKQDFKDRLVAQNQQPATLEH
jgi:protocatechuate 4,5-dioxygenase alpha chain